MLVSHDRVDEIEGIPMKLQALEYFFKQYPEYRGKVVLFQVSREFIVLTLLYVRE